MNPMKLLVLTKQNNENLKYAPGHIHGIYLLHGHQDVTVVISFFESCIKLAMDWCAFSVVSYLNAVAVWLHITVTQ